MTGKLMFVPGADGLSNIIREVDGNNSLGAGALAEAIIDKLTTPPVLRWEGEWLILGDEKIAVSTEDHCGCFWVTLLQNDIGGRCESMEAGRRAAEKALGFPDGLVIEEV